MKEREGFPNEDELFLPSSIALHDSVHVRMSLHAPRRHGVAAWCAVAAAATTCVYMHMHVIGSSPAHLRTPHAGRRDVGRAARRPAGSLGHLASYDAMLPAIARHAARSPCAWRTSTSIAACTLQFLQPGTRPSNDWRAFQLPIEAPHTPDRSARPRHG